MEDANVEMPNLGRIYNSMVLKALRVSPFVQLSINDFIKRSGFAVTNRVMLDRFYHSLNAEGQIYISDEMLDYFGYEGVDFKRRQSYKDMLKEYAKIKPGIYTLFDNYGFAEFYVEFIHNMNNKPAKGDTINEDTEDVSGTEPSTPVRRQISEEKRGDEKEVTVTNTIYSREELKQLVPDKNSNIAKFMKKIGYPHPMEFIGENGKGNTKHLILTYDGFRGSMMRLTTTKGREAQEFFLSMVDLVEIYGAYQHAFTDSENKRLRTENGGLLKKVDEMNAKLDNVIQQNSELKEQNDELLYRTAELQDQNAEIKEQNATLLEQTTAISENTSTVLSFLRDVSKKHVPAGRIPPSLQENLWVYHIPSREEYPYYYCRAQQTRCEANLRHFRENDYRARAVLQLNMRPNARECWNAFFYGTHRMITKNGKTNEFCLRRGVTEAALLAVFKRLQNDQLAEYEENRDRTQDLQEKFDPSFQEYSDDMPDFGGTLDDPEDDESGDELDLTGGDAAPEVEPAEQEAPPVPAEPIEAPAQQEAEPDIPLPANINTPALLTQEDLEAHTVVQLKAKARATGIGGWSRLKKEQLIEWILRHLSRGGH